MKNLILSLALLGAVLSSCKVTFYQVYKADVPNSSGIMENLLVFEDDNCRVSYNLWGNGGNIGFKFYNKTVENLYLNLEESFFILNGRAYDYFKNRIYTTIANTGAAKTYGTTDSISTNGPNFLNLFQTNSISHTNTVGLKSSIEYSTSINEKKIICIPSHTSKVISEYSINHALYRDCDLFIHPKKKDINTIGFSKEESPIVFRNLIVYRTKQMNKPIEFENDFFVSEITNYPSEEIVGSRYEVFCGEKNSTSIRYFKNESPDMFYVEYTKDWTPATLVY